MNSERSDREYILIGKIAEKRRDILKLKEELQTLENVRNNTVDQDDVFTGIEEVIESLPEDVIDRKPMKKPISYEMKLELIDDDHTHASNVTRGNVFAVNGNSSMYYPISWTNGRKYDPSKGKMLKIRNQLRNGPMSIRQMSVFTGYALDTIKDYVKEMDKQGFFKKT